MDWLQITLTILGASVIGYSTNWLAIRMLFRPLHEKRLWGWRLPFTPGVIPRGKKRLGKAMGDMVGGMLLTEEQVVEHLLNPATEEKTHVFLTKAIAQAKLRKVSLEKACAELEGARAIYGEVTELIASWAARLAKSEVLRQQCGALAKEAENNLLDQTVSKSLDLAGGPEAIATSVEQLVDSILKQSSVQNKMRHMISEQVEDFLNSEQSVRYYLPEAVCESTHHFIDEQAPLIIKSIRQYIESPAARKAIKSSIERFFEDTVFKRMLSGFLDIFGSGADGIMNRLGNELTRFFADPGNRAEIMARLHTLLDEILAKKINELSAGLPESEKRKKAEEIAAWAVDRLCAPAKPKQKINTETIIKTVDLIWQMPPAPGVVNVPVRGALAALAPDRELKEAEDIADTEAESNYTGSPLSAGLAAALKDYLTEQSDKTWREAITALDPQGPAKLDNLIAGLLDSFWENDLPSKLAERLARQGMDYLWCTPLNSLLNLLPQGAIQDKAGLFSRVYSYLIRQFVPRLLRFINIRKLVCQRVEQLDELEVESMLLGIMRRELKVIIWLGALLGALLGIGMVAMQLMVK